MQLWFSDLGDNIGTFFSELGTNLGNWFKELGENLGSWFKDLWTNIDNGLHTLSENIGNGISSFFDWFKQDKEEKKQEETKQEDKGSTAINNGVSSVKERFNFVDNVKTNVNDMAKVVTDTTNTPMFSMNINSKYYTGSLTVIDLSWYAPYKEYGDSIICIFCYLSFLWNIFKRLPDIIQGAGASSFSLDMMSDIQAYKETGFGRSSNIFRR